MAAKAVSALRLPHLFALMAAAVALGCGSKALYSESESPGKQYRVKISTVHFGSPDYHVRVELAGISGRQELLYLIGDRHPGLVEVAWSISLSAFTCLVKPSIPSSAASTIRV